MKKLIMYLMLVLCLGTMLTGCSKKEEKTKPAAKTAEKTTEKKTEKKSTEKEVEYQTIGVQSEKAFDILLKNSLGKEIKGIAVKTADKTEYPANMMKENQVLKTGETARFYYTPETTAAGDAAGTEKAVNIVYHVQFTLADGSVLELSSMGFEDIKENVEICFEEEVLFLKYESKMTGDMISTKEQELGAKTQKEAQAAAAAQAASQQQPAAETVQPVTEYAEPVAESIPETTPEPAPETTPEPAPEPPVAETAPEQSTGNCLGDVVIN